MYPTRNWSCGLCFLLLCITGVLIVGCGPRSSGIDPMPEDSNTPGWHEGTLPHDSLERQFRFYIPEELPESAPVVMLLHGGTQSMDAIFRPNAGGTQAWPTVADDVGFLLLVPNGTNIETGAPDGDNQVWNDCRRPAEHPVTQSTADDAGFLTALADWSTNRFDVNPNRQYVTGVSNGGKMAFRLAIEQPSRFAAVATFIAQLPVDSACNAPTTPIPMFMANGTDDPITPYAGGSTDGRGAVRSAETTRDIWVNANNADSTQRTTEERPDRDPDDGSIVICEDDPAPSTSAPVRFCRVEGGGHTMPSIEHPLPRWIRRIVGPQNRDVEGARLAWTFLEQH